MKGITLSEQGHIVNALPPVDITGGAETDRIKMTNAAHATFIVQIGASAAAFTKIIANAHDAESSGNTEAIAIKNLAHEETSAGDTLSAFEAMAAAGKTPSENDNIFYVLEIDASELPEDKPWVSVQLTNGVNSVIASVVCILTGYGYQGESNQTAIA